MESKFKKAVGYTAIVGVVMLLAAQMMVVLGIPVLIALALLRYLGAC